MTSEQSRDPVSRRTALMTLGAGGAGLAVAATSRHVFAQDSTSDMANHPIVGTWNVTTPNGPSLAVFFADGTNIQSLPITQAGPNGLEFVSAQVGIWEPVSERGIHFTGVQWHTDAEGNYVGSVTIDAYPVVSEDGLTLYDENTKSGPVIRDASGVIVADLRGAGGPPATGVRMGAGNTGFPDAGAAGATPTS